MAGPIQVGVWMIGLLALGGQAGAAELELLYTAMGRDLVVVVQAPHQPQIEVGQERVLLHDDGQGADALAGDGLWSGSSGHWPVQPAMVVLRLDADRVVEQSMQLAHERPRILARVGEGEPLMVSEGMASPGQVAAGGGGQDSAPDPLSYGVWLALLGLAGLAGGLWLGLSLRSA